MFKSRMFKLVLIVIVVALSLVVVSSVWAQGPGGGRGQGGRYGQGGQGGQGGWGAPDGAGDGVPNLDGSGQPNGWGQANGLNQYRFNDGLMLNLPAASDQPLTPEVTEALLAGLQDEHHAYAIYQAVIDQFGAVRPFTAIQSAEAQHITQLEMLFERYEIALPDAPAAVTAPPFGSLSEACAAAAEAEVANFDLYDQWIATAEAYPDIAWVFTSLRNASEFRHLPAFERCAR
jgi:hypothetical protein